MNITSAWFRVRCSFIVGVALLLPPIASRAQTQLQISALPEAITPDRASILPIIIPGAGTGASRARKITIDNLLNMVVGGGGGSSAWADITGKPTTIAGFGITDAQPLDTDLTNIAGVVTTVFGRSVLAVADAAAARTLIGAGTSSFDGVFGSLTAKPTTLLGYGITDAQNIINLNQITTRNFADLQTKPTTILGYGITDAFTQTLADARYPLLAHTHTFAALTAKPTTLSGYGITDGLTATLAAATYSPLAHAHAFSAITSKPTTLSGYGITDGGTGNVLGPTDSINNNIALFDGVTGKLLKDSGQPMPVTPVNTVETAAPYQAMTGYSSTLGTFNRRQLGFTDMSGSVAITQIENYTQTTLNLGDPNVDKFVGWDDAITVPAGGAYRYFAIGSGFVKTGVAGSKTISVPAGLGLIQDPISATSFTQFQQTTPSGTTVTANIPAVYSTMMQPTDLAAADEFAGIDSSGLVITRPKETAGSGITAFQSLTPNTGTTPHTITMDAAVSGNAVVTLTGNSKLVVNNTTSGQKLNLIVRQAANAFTLTIPTDSATTTTGTIALNGTQDWLEGTYTGATGAATNYLWRQPVGPLSTPVPASCAVAGTTGSTTGTSQAAGAGNASNRKYLSNTFVATETSICRIDANLQAVGAPNFTLNAAIYTDGVRVTDAGASTSNGSSTVQLVVTPLNNYDNGALITGPGIPANTYVGVVDATLKTVTLVNARTGGTAVTAGAGAGTGTVQIYGVPGVIVGAASTNSVSTVTIPTLLTGTGSADDTPTSFTGLTATGMTVGAAYHVVIYGNASTYGTDYINWLYAVTAQSSNNISRSTDGAAWVGINSAKKSRWRAYRSL